MPSTYYMCYMILAFLLLLLIGDLLFRPEDFLVPELQATEEEKSKLESGLTNGDEPMDQDLSDVPTKCISATESIEIK